jgi:hypothetical protein
MSTPEKQWSPGYGNVTPGRWIRLWAREHAPYDVACTKGPARRGAEPITSHVITLPDGRAQIVAHLIDDRYNDQPAPMHGDIHPTVADADRARYDAGLIEFEETVKVGAVGAYNPPWGHPADPDGEHADVSDYATEAAARTMVYGSGR